MRKDIKFPLTMLGIFALMLCFLLVGLGMSEKHDKHSSVAAERLHKYCGLVRTAMDVDITLLQSNDQKEQELAASQFANLAAHQSVDEINLCSSIPPKLDERDTCYLNHDYACLARLARLAYNSIDL